MSDDEFDLITIADERVSGSVTISLKVSDSNYLAKNLPGHEWLPKPNALCSNVGATN
jgi:hypothetical protein